jgi:hypothetical protein
MRWPLDVERAAKLSAAALFALSLVLLLFLSRLVGPSFDEIERVKALEAVESVVLEAAGQGFSALSSGQARLAYAGHGSSTLLMLAAAWSKLSLGRVGLLDLLTSARLPWLVLASLAPASVYAIARASFGAGIALISALTLLSFPRWLHGAVVGSEGVALASGSLVVLALYVGSLPGGRRAHGYAALSGIALGFALGVSLSALWVVPLVLTHYALIRFRSSARLLRCGRLAVPSAIVYFALLAPLGLFLQDPLLWQDDVVALVRWTLAPLGPRIQPAQYAGGLVTASPVPGGYAATWLLWTTPAAFLLAFAIGVALLAQRGLARRFASGTLRPRRDARGLGTLVALGLFGTIVGPEIVPPVLTTFPPRAECALPFAALAIGPGLSWAAARAAERRAPYFAVAVLALVAFTTLHAPRTLSASFDAVLGGARSVQRLRLLPLGDGSELSELTQAIDARGAERLAIATRDVPDETWSRYRRLGRLETRVNAAGGGELVLVRGRGKGQVVAVVERDGARLWTLLDGSRR